MPTFHKADLGHKAVWWSGKSSLFCRLLCKRSLHANGAMGLYSAGAGCASFTSLPLLSASSSESSREAPSICSWRLPDRLEEKVMGPPLLQTTSRQQLLKCFYLAHNVNHSASGCPWKKKLPTEEQGEFSSSAPGHPQGKFHHLF